MTQHIGVEIFGLDELLARIPTEGKRHAVGNNIVLRTAIALQAEMRKRIVKRTGATARSVGYKFLPAEMAAYVGDVGVTSGSRTGARSLLYLQYGTGIFGPRNARIFPKFAKALRWPSSRAGHNDLTLSGRHRAGVTRAGVAEFSFAKSIRGMKAQPFVMEAWTATLPLAAAFIHEAGRSLFEAGEISVMPGLGASL